MKCISNLTLKLNDSAIKQLTEGANFALGATAEALKTEVVNAQVFPFKEGEMQNKSTEVNKTNLANGEATIEVNAPYARRLYFHPEYNFRKTNNANAKGKWFEDWLPGGKNEKFAQQAFSKLYKKYAGGVIK